MLKISTFFDLFKNCLKTSDIIVLRKLVNINKEKIMKTYILYNPLSGTGKAKEDAEALLGRYDTAEVMDVTKTNAVELVSSLDEGDNVIICGGDGTVNHFANDLYDVDIKCNVLYYPSGSGNDFIRDIGASKEDGPIDIKKYIKDLPTVEVNGKTYRFLDGVGYGLDGRCCAVADKLKETPGKKINYTAIAIKEILFNYKPTNAEVIIDGKSYHYKNIWAAPAMKGRFYGGGLMPTPAQDRSSPDGKLSFMALTGANKIKTLLVLASAFKGEHVKHTKEVTILTGKEITVKFDRPVELQIDGEAFLNISEYSAKACVKAPVSEEV